MRSCKFSADNNCSQQLRPTYTEGETMSIYVKLDGISGDITTQGYQGWVECLHMYFGGASKKVSTTVGDTNNRVQSRPYFAEIALVKHSDCSSPNIFAAAHSSQPLDKIEIQFVATNDNPAPYEKYVLTNAYISHVSREFSVGQDRPLEFLTINFEKIETTYYPHNSEGQMGSPISSGYNLAEAVAM